MTPTTQQHDLEAEHEGLVQSWIALQTGFGRIAARVFAEATDEAAMPPSSLEVLLVLLQAVPYHSVQMTHLARELGISTAGVTKITDRLLQAGLIERSPCVSDRRVVRATLTDDGRLLAQRASETLGRSLQREVLAKIGHDELRRLAETIRTLGGR